MTATEHTTETRWEDEATAERSVPMRRLVSEKTLAFVQRMAAEAQARMDARAASGEAAPGIPIGESPAVVRQRWLDECIPRDWQGMTLDTFRPYTPELRNAIASAGIFINEPSGYFYVWGGVGLGKTHVASGTAIRLRERGHHVRVYRASDVATMLREAVRDKNLTEKMNILKRTKVLVIDDFGAEYASDFLAAEWFDLLDARYRELAPTIITSNVAPDELGMPRLASRFTDNRYCTVVAVTGQDYRALSKPPTGNMRGIIIPPATMTGNECPVCHGTGTMGFANLPITHPGFGRVYPCSQCRGGPTTPDSGWLAFGGGQ